MSITKINLKYLTLPNFSDGICITDKDMAQRLEQYPFLDYAAKNWGSEIDKLDGDDFIPVLDKLTSNATALEITSQVFSIHSVRHFNWSQEFPRGIPALVLAAAFDLPTTLKRMVGNGHQLEDKGIDGETALIRAARFGHLENVRVLLHLGADKNARDYMNETALQRAARNGENEVIEVLLGKAADVNLKASSDWTALMSAVSSNNIRAVQMLVDAGAELMAETVWGDSALSIATRNGQEAIATLLANRGAILPRGSAGRRASTVASRRGFKQLVRRLTADYEAVARKPLQRQSLKIMGGLSRIQEPTEATDDETAINTTSETEASETDRGDFSEAMEDLEYSMGFSRRYDLKEVIGKGHYAQVFSCTNKVTGTAYAAKILTVEKWDKERLTHVRSEFQILRKVQQKSHANILRLVDFFAEYTDGKIYIVLELVPGGELFDFIVLKHRLTEDESRKIILQVFSGLDFLVSRGLFFFSFCQETNAI